MVLTVQYYVGTDGLEEVALNNALAAWKRYYQFVIAN